MPRRRFLGAGTGRLGSSFSDMVERRRLTIGEGPRVPLDGLILGWGPMLPFPVAVLAAWLGGEGVATLASSAAIVWGGALLIFLSGVRRGLSFRTEGGPRWSQLAMFAWLFWSGLAALMVTSGWALWLLLAGFLSLLVLDPLAARRGEVPLYFARLRPWQMAVPVASMALLFLIA